MHNTTPYDFDLLVAGGGLAGLTLALQAADRGYRVAVFEKENYPFHKVCGEYISMESWDFLQRCGLPLGAWALPQIRRLCVSDTKGKEYTFGLPLGGFGVSRYKLDHALYELGLEKGVHFFTGCRVNEIAFKNEKFIAQTGKGNFTTRLAAGCFGKRSNLDVKWKRSFITEPGNRLNNLIGVKYHLRYDHPADTIALHNFRDGYCGISKIEEDKSCLCYLTTADNLRRCGNSIPEMEQHILSGNRHLQAIFRDAAYLYTAPVTISQVSFDKKSQLEDHVLLLGDAAGMITPLCGNGMSMAMHAAKLAFEQMDLFLSGKTDRAAMEKMYVSEWNRHFASRTRFGRVVQSFFGGSLSTSVFLKLMHAMPAISRAVIRQTHGDGF